uniref:Uncharacterized protein n=1 Tax=Romanomermis culicivorax TaxID=13658 RepID=A0A915JHW5_ROMCU
MFELDDIYTDHVAATSSSSLPIGSADISSSISMEYSEYPNCQPAFSGNPKPPRFIFKSVETLKKFRSVTPE